MPGLTFEDEEKASAIAELDLEWMCREVDCMKRQLHPSPETNRCGAPKNETSAARDLSTRCFDTDVRVYPILSV